MNDARKTALVWCLGGLYILSYTRCVCAHMLPFVVWNCFSLFDRVEIICSPSDIYIYIYMYLRFGCWAVRVYGIYVYPNGSHLFWLTICKTHSLTHTHWANVGIVSAGVEWRSHLPPSFLPMSACVRQQLSIIPSYVPRLTPTHSNRNSRRFPLAAFHPLRGGFRNCCTGSGLGSPILGSSGTHRRRIYDYSAESSGLRCRFHGNSTATQNSRKTYKHIHH